MTSHFLNVNQKLSAAFLNIKNEVQKLEHSGGWLEQYKQNINEFLQLNMKIDVF